MIASRIYPSKSERLRQHLLDEVSAGRLTVSEPLPSENTLAETFGVCRNTVRRAFGDLERAGLIRRIRGKGTFLRVLPPDANHQRQHPMQQQNASAGSQQLDAYALVLPEVRRSLYPSLIRGFGRAAGELTRQVMVCQSSNDIYRQADIILQVMDRRVAGVALVSATLAPTPAYHIGLLQSAGVAVVLCHRPVAGAVAPCVRWDWQEVGRLAGEAFVARGHRRVAFLSLVRYGVPEAYAVGLRTVLEQAGLSLADELVHYGTSPAAAAGVGGPGEALGRMLDGPQPPTAVFCHDDPCAEEVYLWAMDRGLRVPGDLSILCAGDAARDGAISKRLACVTIDESRLGRRAVDLLAEINAGVRKMTDQQNVCVPLGLSEGETLGNA